MGVKNQTDERRRRTTDAMKTACTKADTVRPTRRRRREPADRCLHLWSAASSPVPAHRSGRRLQESATSVAPLMPLARKGDFGFPLQWAHPWTAWDLRQVLVALLKHFCGDLNSRCCGIWCYGLRESAGWGHLGTSIERRRLGSIDEAPWSTSRLRSCKKTLSPVACPRVLWAGLTSPHCSW